MRTGIANTQSSLRRRIRQFYNLLNQRAFKRCYQMIDPRVRQQASSVTLFQYESSLGEFLDRFGLVKILEITISPHLNERSEVYAGRDFAVGRTTWTDQTGRQHRFAERWVREKRTWYTRSTGFLAPETAGSDGKDQAC